MTTRLPHLHFLGIGGVGMAGVAFLLKSQGYEVSGCDKHVSPRTKWLEHAGIPVVAGHDPAHLADVDELIVTPAVQQSEPELETARAKCIPIRRRGEVLADLVNATDGIAVCGTHGKTTTATFTAKLLHLLGDNPGWCIGGECGDWPVAAAGRGPFVVEADESDGTLALYHAHTLVVTTMDFDHPEHFKTIDAYHDCFAQAEAQAEEIIHAWELDVTDWPELENMVSGHHNVMNARAAIEVALRRGHARDKIIAVLPQALRKLPDRRFQTIFPITGRIPSADFTVVTDYAHHPAELKCAISMAQALKPKRLRVLFQPHRYSRTKMLKDEFPAAFDAVDEVVLLPVYPAFEEPVHGGDIADLYASFRRRQSEHGLWPQGLRLARNPEEAWLHIFLTSEKGDLTLLAGAGNIIDLVPRIQSDLKTGSVKTKMPPLQLSKFSFYRTGGVSYGGGKPFYVGTGSNTWFSDCATDIEIVQAPQTLETLGTAPDKTIGPGPDSKTMVTVPAGTTGARLLDSHPELAFMAGIPGTVGGWTKMNAGAFGDSFGNYVSSVLVRSEDGSFKRIPAKNCGFSYRSSKIPGLIVAVDIMRTVPGNMGTVEYLAKRKKFPPRTCGSVFRNPSPETPAGKLLDEAGAKELSVGGAYVWQEHANVIVAGENASSSDILALARLMAAAVREKFGICLEPEVFGLDVS